MPELPEVEVVRRGLDEHVVGRTITRVEVLHDRPVRRHPGGPRDFETTLVGRTVTGTHRRGKFLWLPVSGGDALMVHLGMSGQMLVQAPGVEAERHLRIRFGLDDGAELRFVDQRMFGGVWLSAGDPPPEVAHIGLDPLDPGFDPEAAVRRVRRSRSGVKRLLLDQTVVSGIGNIYADEALWRARIHGDRPGDRLTAVQVRALLGAVREVMLAALAQGGTSFDALYVNVNGQSGYFDRSLEAYGREGEPCSRCGAPMVRAAFANRSSYFCPVCQPRPRGGRRVPAGGPGSVATN